MFKHLFGAAAVALLTVGSVSAQHGGGGGGGGGHGGGGYGGGGYGGGRGYGYGGYGRGYGYGGFGYGGYGLYGFGYGLGYPYYPYYGGSYYGLGVPDYSSFGGAGSGGYGNFGGPAIVPYSSGYTPSPSLNIDPTAIPTLPAPLNTPGAPLNPPATPVAISAPGTATLTVVVPEGGQVWFDNTLSPTKGSKWVYTSPKLESGKTYTLNVKARWSENGNDKSYDIPLRIVAGDSMTMDLTKIR